MEIGDLEEIVRIVPKPAEEDAPIEIVPEPVEKEEVEEVEYA